MKDNTSSAIWISTKPLTNPCGPFRLKSNNIPSKGTRKEISQDAEPYFPKNIN